MYCYHILLSWRSLICCAEISPASLISPTWNNVNKGSRRGEKTAYNTSSLSLVLVGQKLKCNFRPHDNFPISFRRWMKVESRAVARQLAYISTHIQHTKALSPLDVFTNCQLKLRKFLGIINHKVGNGICSVWKWVWKRSFPLDVRHWTRDLGNRV